MYKTLFITSVLTLFVGCGNPEPAQKQVLEQIEIQIPSWYTNPPKDTENFYAVASAKSMKKAKNQASNSLRKNIKNELDAIFHTPNNKLSPNADKLKEILNVDLHICNTISLRRVKLVKSKVFQGQTLLLVSIPKKDVFIKILPTLNEIIKNLENVYLSNINLAPLKRYVHIKPLMTQYSYLASVTSAKQISFSDYNPDNNYRILKNLNDEYELLKSTINFYVMSDGNSRIYVKGVKKALQQEGMELSNSMQDSDTLKLIITSQTTELEKYSFMVSSNLVKFITLDANKTKISFRQHTITGKSRKSYKDAKQQTAGYLDSKIRKLGIFTTIGIKND